MSRLTTVFAINVAGLNISRALAVAGFLTALLLVMLAAGEQRYVLAVSFGALFVALTDPGGGYGDRVTSMIGVAVIGSLLTLAGYGLDGYAWGWIALAAFVVTLLAGLGIRFGPHGYATGLLLNVWFLVALSLPAAYHLDHVETTARAQALAWLIGSGLWIAASFLGWLAHGRRTRPSHFPELPGDRSSTALSRPVVLFALVRAFAVAVAVAVAFGLQVPNADWMPIAALVSMKPSLKQSALAAERRLAGAILGAGLACLLLVSVDNKYALDVVIIVLGATAAALWAVNYALYTAAIAATVLIAVDLPHPTAFGEELRRVLFTLAGVGIGYLVTLLPYLLQQRVKRAGPAPARAA